MRIFDRRAALPIFLTILVGCGGAPMSAKEAPPAPPMTEAAAPAESPQAMPPPGPQPVGVAAFGDVARGESDGRARSRGGAAKASPPAPKGATPQPPNSTPTGGETQPVHKEQSIIVYSAQLNLAVFEVEHAMKRIEELAKGMGGFLAKREDKTIVIRVPADRFDDALHGVESLGDMLHRNILSEDVTEEFRDLEVRLKGSRAVQERLTQLLSKATKVEESIAIERELDRVTMEIDRIEGRMKFLRDRAAYSTITINFQPKASENVSQSPFKMPTPWLSQLGLARLFQL